MLVPFPVQDASLHSLPVVRLFCHRDVESDAHVKNLAIDKRLGLVFVGVRGPEGITALGIEWEVSSRVVHTTYSTFSHGHTRLLLLYYTLYWK
jgi:hypothetical protein